MPDEETKQVLYEACCKGDWKLLRENLILSGINISLDNEGNTALHLATRHGHIEIIRLLLRYHASRTVVNKEGKIPEQMNSDSNIIKQYEMPVRPLPTKDDNYFVDTSLDVKLIEWNDSYENAYRIAFENHQHMKRWITKIPLKKLLQAIDKDYLDKLTFPSNETLVTLKKQLQTAIDKNELMNLISMYTGTSGFYKLLNEDLAKLGSDFRFVTARLDYPDNEPPKDLGEYIYASLIVNHKAFQDYRYAGTTCRGMNITVQDLEVYKPGKIIITRAFLSTSADRSIAEIFLDYADEINRPPVICQYSITNPRSSLYIASMSKMPDENEVLIVPFTVFEIQKISDDIIKLGQIEHKIKIIELIECGPTQN